MMSFKQRKYIWIPFISGILLLTSIQSAIAISDKTKVILASTAAGATAGGVIGGFVHEPLIGAVLGGGIGAILAHHHDQTHYLKKHPVDICHVEHAIILTIASNHLFEINTAYLTPEGTATLEAVTDFLKQYPQENIHISANSTPIGHQLKFQNQSLSLQRAEAVAGYFWAKNIRPGPQTRRLTYSDNRDHYPITTYKTLQGFQYNRRIQIVIYSNELPVYPLSSPIKRPSYNF